MTPMIDVVFLLIIFFLVSSHLAKQEVRPPLELPLAASQPLAVDLSVQRLTVNIHPNGTLWVGGAMVDASRLATLMRLHAAEHGRAAAVRIRTDRSVAYAVVEPLLRQAAVAGITQLSFAVREAR